MLDIFNHVLPRRVFDRFRSLAPDNPGLKAFEKLVSLWDMDAQALLNDFVETEPVLVQISAAKRLRDRAERDAKRDGEERVTAARVAKSRDALRQGEPA